VAAFGQADGAALRLFLPVLPRPLLIIAGAGHVGQALAAQAALAGFEVAVVDDRPEWIDPANFPAGARLVCAPAAEALAGWPVDRHTFIALVTRGHLPDREALAACVASPAAYIGMIGSKRKVSLVRERLLATGRAGPGDLARVHAPVGLDIGAETAPEIAVSILAQMIAVRRGAVPVLAAPPPARGAAVPVP
jgi:xanthine dehydrogenase accessory factor